MVERTAVGGKSGIDISALISEGLIKQQRDPPLFVPMRDVLGPTPEAACLISRGFYVPQSRLHLDLTLFDCDGRVDFCLLRWKFFAQ
jgi:hypothetical protein